MPTSYASTINGKDKLFFVKLLLKWSGSVYQAVYNELLYFLVSYTIVTLIYRHALDREEQIGYRHFVNYAKTLQDGTPLSFMLGFFVSAMIGRWWSVYLNIPWMSKPTFMLQSYIHSNNKRFKEFAEHATPIDQQLRRIILRYLNLAWVLQMTSLSKAMQIRFPEFQKDKKKTIQERLHSINQDEKIQNTFGVLVTEQEIETFEEMARQKQESSDIADIPYWAPLHWASNLLHRGYDAGLIATDHRYRELTNLIQGFRGTLGTLWLYMDTSVPLVYSQVVIIAVYSYFVAEIFTSQIPAHNTHKTSSNSTLNAGLIMDPYIPVISVVKFLFYVGWFKVAIALMNPLGDDAQDFPVREIFDGNLQASIERGLPCDYMYPRAMTEKDTFHEIDEETVDDKDQMERIKQAYRVIYNCAGMCQTASVQMEVKISPRDEQQASLLNENDTTL